MKERGQGSDNPNRPDRPRSRFTTHSDTLRLVGPGDPKYPYALAHELTHHTINGRPIRGIVREKSDIPTDVKT